MNQFASLLHFKRYVFRARGINPYPGGFRLTTHDTRKELIADAITTLDSVPLSADERRLRRELKRVKSIGDLCRLCADCVLRDELHGFAFYHPEQGYNEELTEVASAEPQRNIRLELLRFLDEFPEATGAQLTKQLKRCLADDTGYGLAMRVKSFAKQARKSAV